MLLSNKVNSLLGLPDRTELNKEIGKRITKEKFYSKLDLETTDERMFIDEISSIHWMNKISPDSMNIDIGDGIEEIEVFKIFLKRKNVKNKFLRMIDESIEHPILFVLMKDDECSLCIAYKEKKVTGGAKVIDYYSTEWLPCNCITIQFSGLSTGEIYQSLITQISGGRLKANSNGNDFVGVVLRDIEYQNDLKSITRLEDQIKKTTQPNKKLELVHQVREIKKKWGEENG